MKTKKKDNSTSSKDDLNEFLKNVDMNNPYFVTMMQRAMEAAEIANQKSQNQEEMIQQAIEEMESENQ